MSEILKYAGNIEKVIGEDEIYSKMNLGDEMKRIREEVINKPTTNNEPKVTEYQTHPNKKA
jgi:hypothetical protein